MFLEYFGAKYHYIKGKDNVLADAFSRLPRMDSWQNLEGKSDANMKILYGKVMIKHHW